MNVRITHRSARIPLTERFPLLELMNPGALTPAVVVTLIVSLAVALGLFAFAGFPAWSITLIVLAALVPIGVIKWRSDRQRYGTTAMILGILLATQGMHTIEHFVQWGQYYLLFLPARQSTGLVSAANAEWVHFVWNWGVLLVVLALVRGGMRNPLAILLLIVAGAHAIEHTYLFIRYHEVLGALRDNNVLTVTAQGLPGIVGRDGWLARSELTRGTFLCTLPGITTANRLDVHFWWNAIEMTLLLGAGMVFMQSLPVKKPTR